jgi:hypothetical protein
VPGIVEKLTWVQIAEWRHSFLSKAFTLLSLASFGLAYFGKFLEQHDDAWRLEAWLFGSVLFLIGYVLSGMYMPNEFRGSSGDLVDIVNRMTQINSYDFYKSRQQMTQNLVARFKHHTRLATLKGPLAYAERSANFEHTGGNWTSNASALYHSDVALRQYDRPNARWFSAFVIAVGLGLLLAPTAVNFFHAILVLAEAA